MTGRVTSHDIARRAGVSRATVSYVLNDRQDSSVSAATRTRVLHAARDLGYVPNSAARMLVSGRSGTIGLVLADAALLRVDAFIPQMLYGISRVCSRSGYKLLVESLDEPVDVNAYLDLARSKRIDSMIVFAPRSRDRALRHLVESGFPVLIFGSLAHPQENAVGTFNAGAARRATEHLIRLGHRRIAHITYAPLHYIGARQRMQGYKASLTAAGIRFNPRLIGFGEYSCESGYLAMTKILSRGAPPSALFAGNDVIAIGAMAALDEAGLAIPRDVAVVGFDNIPMSAYTRPGLTTIQVAAVEQGELAAEAALALLQGKKIGSRQDVVPLPLVIRDSCGARLEGLGVRGQGSRQPNP